MSNLLKNINRLFETSADVYEYDKSNTRLFSPEDCEKKNELKKFPSGVSDIFFIGWQISNGEVLNAFMSAPNKLLSYRYDISSFEYSQAHTHDYLELAYVVRGNFSQIINGKKVGFCEGELCLIDTNCIHKDMLCEDSTVLFIGIPDRLFDEIIRIRNGNGTLEEFLENALASQKSLNQYIHLRPEHNSKKDVEDILDTLLIETGKALCGYEYVTFGLLSRLLKLLCTEYEFSLTKEQSKQKSILIGDEIIAYIQRHFRDIKISDLEKKFNYNADYFNRLIKSRMNMTYKDYVQLLRIEYSKGLLLDKKSNIDDIAFECGYKNKGYFYKIFKESVGMTPAEYRKKSTGRIR